MTIRLEKYYFVCHFKETETERESVKVDRWAKDVQSTLTFLTSNRTINIVYVYVSGIGSDVMRNLLNRWFSGRYAIDVLMNCLEL